MIKKIDTFLNWLLVALLIVAALIGFLTETIIAAIWVGVFIAALIVRLICEKKVNFKRKE